MTAAIVPVRALRGAKERLSGVLNPEQRRLLSEAMLRDLLGQLLRHPRLQQTLVVTQDAETRKLAERLGAEVLDEPAASGLSAAVAHAFQVCRDAGVADCLFMPADLPLVAAADLDLLLNDCEELDLVLAPAADLGGTNGLLLRLEHAFPFAFGADSFRRHLRLARAAGLNAGVRRSLGLGLDLDEPEDLPSAWQLSEALGGAVETRRVMVKCGFPGRLRNKFCS